MNEYLLTLAAALAAHQADPQDSGWDLRAAVIAADKIAPSRGNIPGEDLIASARRHLAASPSPMPFGGAGAMKYIVSGRARGGISSHRTLAGAYRALVRDRRTCAALGGGAYSDAGIQHEDGSPLTPDELDNQLWELAGA